MALYEQGERTEPATPRKRQEARERGQVARSQDLTAALVLLAACLALHFFGLDGLRKLGDLAAGGLRRMRAWPLDLSGAVEGAGAAGLHALAVLVPLAAILFAVAAAANLLQVGFLVSGTPVTPDAARLNPFRGLARIVSLRGLFRGGFGLLKVAAIGAVGVAVLWSELAGPRSPGAAALISASAGEAAVYAIHLAVELGLKVVVVILVLAILDYGFQLWLHERDLRMTRWELKEELRRMEGDPKIKERRRRVQQQLAYHRMMRDVPKASVVVTNPTHLAVAIRYEREAMPAPRVVAKGEGFIAQRIREVAMEHGVAVVERKELARALYQAVEVGEEIPREFYRAVAEVLAYVYRMGSAAPGTAAGRGRGAPALAAAELEGAGR